MTCNRLTIATGLLLVAGMIGCASRGEATRAALLWEPEGRAACARAGDAPVWADSAEAAAVLATEGRVRRLGCRLVFALPGGRTHEIADGFAPEALPLRAAYRGPVRPWALDLVEVTLDEQAGFYLVNRYGTAAFLAGRPIVAPDSQRFAVSALDLEAGYQENVVEVWRVERDSPTLELAISSEQWGPSDLVWRDAQTLEFVQNFPTAEVGVYRSVPALLRQANGRWLLEVAAY